MAGPFHSWWVEAHLLPLFPLRLTFFP
jgi:hypothetical protein